MNMTRLKAGFRRLSQSEDGFSLLEMIITLVVLSILVLGAIPLAQNSVKRERELKLREALRTIRNAIDEFKRDAAGGCVQGAITSGNPTIQGGSTAASDPRTKVVIDDCTIFDAVNLDRYPPTLEILVEGVKVKSRGIGMPQSSGPFDGPNATEIGQVKEIKKFYLRDLPIDPMTGRSDTWVLRSSYQSKDSSSWDKVNVFDVRSSSDANSLGGDKYSDW